MSGRALPDFSVRVSDRARHVRLTVTPREGLVVVVPRGWRGDAASIVASKQAWAERSLERVSERLQVHRAGPAALLPFAVDVRMTGERLEVTYAPAAGGSARAVRDGASLRVSGAEDARDRLSALSRWLDREARVLLPARAETLADRHGFAPQRIRITRARSRWGSCSARGSISLNRALVFLPLDLVDALVLHEFAHLRVLDHSPRFWRELRSLDPHAVQNRARLRSAMELVPPWAEA